MVHNAFADDPVEAQFTLWAEGLHEVLGYHCTRMALRPSVQFRGFKDLDDDGRADLETVSDGWDISGDYMSMHLAQV